MLITNTTMHTHSGVIAEPFGDTGACRIVPIDGDKPGRAFILDADATRELGAFLSALAERAEAEAAAKRPTYRARDLRIVSNETADYSGGYSVELRDGSVIAGPYAARVDAVSAKAALVSGRPVQAAG